MSKMLNSECELIKPAVIRSTNAITGGGQEFLTCDIKIPSFLRNCRPEPYCKCYVHAIEICTEHEMPDVQRKQHFYKLMASDKHCFGIVTRTPLPYICRFPVYTDLGQLGIRILNNYGSIIFTNAKLQIVINFHKFLFKEIVRKVKKCFTFDNENSSNSFFIVPLMKETDSGRLVIDWSLMRGKMELQFDRPSEFERDSNDFSEANYLNQVVTPWYKKRGDIPLFYVVTNTNTAIYIDSKMELKNDSYADYFWRRYNLTVKQKNVQLFEVRVITNILESIKPRAITASAKLKKRKKRDFPTFFHPEFVTKQKFPAVYWYKSIVLPSVLHRLHYLLLAEDLRQSIVQKAGIGKLCLTTDPVLERRYFMENNPGEEISQLTDSNTVKYAPGDPAVFVDPPLLSLFEDRFNPPGPTQYDILKALTLRGANDTICLERLETLGDSFLKFIVSFSIFVQHTEITEGEMTKMRSLVIDNHNLTDCGRKYGIPGCIQGTTFSVDTSWIAPSFCVPAEIRSFILENDKLPALFRVSFRDEDQLSGIVSDETMNTVKEMVERCKRSISKLDEAAALFYVGRHEVSHKSVADAVEALIGVYLQACGIQGAFDVMKYFGIIADENYQQLMQLKVPTSVLVEDVASVKKMMPSYRRIEKLLQYEFRDKGLILQAFTHPSCVTNKLTECYQRLEFIGDALLDFLITSYIYEYCGNLLPGQITDLKSALVNNNMFGAIVVRLGLHEFILDPVEAVKEEIKAFADHQKGKTNDGIYGYELITMVKNSANVKMAEEIKVPKILADVFESLAGAVFVDCAFDLRIIWRIFYNLMIEEIQKFSVEVPINPVRALYELNTNAKFESVGLAQGDRVVKMVMPTKHGLQTFYGKGMNSQCAKRAASKLGLEYLGHTKFIL